MTKTFFILQNEKNNTIPVAQINYKTVHIAQLYYVSLCLFLYDKSVKQPSINYREPSIASYSSEYAFSREVGNKHILSLLGWKMQITITQGVPPPTPQSARHLELWNMNSK